MMKTFMNIEGQNCITCNMFPTEMLETATQRKILRVLAEKNKRYTLEELSEMCQRSLATVSRALERADSYPFIEKGKVPESKKLAFRLDPDSRYTEAIRLFFDVERNRERQNGMIPVDVWNLLEDVTGLVSRGIDGFVEFFLFGSYATGEYHAGSDIDLLLAHTPQEDVTKKLDSLVQKIADERIQVVTVEIEEDELKRRSGEELLDIIRSRGPVRNIDTLIPLTGEVRS